MFGPFLTLTLFLRSENVFSFITQACFQLTLCIFEFPESQVLQFSEAYEKQNRSTKQSAAVTITFYLATTIYFLM